MVENVFLTENRRALLEGDDRGLTEQSLRNAKSRIRVRARLALAELIEVAESDELENEDIFEAKDVGRLVRALMIPADGLTPRRNFDGDDGDYRAEYGYQLHLQGLLSHQLDGFEKHLYHDPDREVFLPGLDEDGEE